MADVCPNCGKPAAPGARACAYCPMSFSEEEQVPRCSASTEGLLDAVLAGALLVVVGGFAWRMLSKAVDLGKNPGSFSRPRSLVSRALLPLPKLQRVGAAPAKSTAPTNVWRLRGSVYNLVTLEPVPRCSIVFKDESSHARFETATDAQGRYHVELPPLPGRGYQVLLPHPDFSPTYLYPGSENVRGWALEKRRTLAKDLARSLDGSYSLQPAGRRELVTDFYLAPKLN